MLFLLAFMKGFSAGVWRSLFNLVGTAAAFLGAYLLSGPAVDLLDARFKLLSKAASWWHTAFAALPPLAMPYGSGTFDEAFGAIGGGGWGSILQSAVKQNLLAVEHLAGANPTWGQMLGFALARLLLSAVAFFVLLSILRLVVGMFLKSLGFTAPDSLLARLSGGVVEGGISVLWLAIFSGMLYPLLVAGVLSGVREQAAASRFLPMLLRTYEWLWPAIVSRVNLSFKG